MPTRPGTKKTPKTTPIPKSLPTTKTTLCRVTNWPRKQSELNAGHHGIVVASEDEDGMVPVWCTIRERTSQVHANPKVGTILKADAFVGGVPSGKYGTLPNSFLGERFILPITDEMFEASKALGFSRWKDMHANLLIGLHFDRDPQSGFFFASEYEEKGRDVSVRVIQVPR